MLRRHPKILVTSLLFVFLMPTALAADFSDVPNTNARYVAINYLAVQKILSGYKGNVFKPDQMVNRAEALKMILTGSNIALLDRVTSSPFQDVQTSDWFVKYVATAKERKIVIGNTDGTFSAGRDVTRAEFVKMLLVANTFNPDQWENKNFFKDVPKDQWFDPYMNYAGKAGIIMIDKNNNVHPNEKITRGEVAEILYLMMIIRNGKDTKFLLSQAEAQMSQIDTYIANSNAIVARHASDLAVDMTQQALKNMPENKTVLSSAKLARSYNFLVSGYISLTQNKFTESKEFLNQTISKATEAWEADHDSQTQARHIKDRAAELLGRIPGTTQSQERTD